MTQDIRLRVALDRAAYALFQLKRFAHMPKEAIAFCQESHAEACKALDEDYTVTEARLIQELREALLDVRYRIGPHECNAACRATIEKLLERTAPSPQQEKSDAE